MKNVAVFSLHGIFNFLVLLSTLSLSSCKQKSFGKNKAELTGVSDFNTGDLAANYADLDQLDTSNPLRSTESTNETSNATNNDKTLVSITSNSPSTIGAHTTASETATWQGWARDNVNDNLSYDPNKSAKSNFATNEPGRANLPDLTIASPDGQLHITSSVALAGAIASVKFKGEELIHATHGAAFQYHIRYSDIGIKNNHTKQVYFNECDNPTEAGNMDNDAGIPNWLGESSSYLLYYGSNSKNGIQEIFSGNKPTDFTAPRTSSAADYGSGKCFNNKDEWHTGFVIKKWVSAGWDSPITEKRYNNVIEMKAEMLVPEAYSKKVVQLELIAYLKRWAWFEWEYSAVPNTIRSATSEATVGGGDDGYAKIFSNQDKSFAMGMISFHKKGEPDIADPALNTSEIFVSYEQQPVMYTNGDSAGGHSKRIIQSDWHFNYPKADQPKTGYTYIALGTVEEVRGALQDIYQSALQNPEFETKDNASRLTVKLGKAGGDVTGSVTNHYLDKVSGSYIVEGWACQIDRHESIPVHPYFGGNIYDSANPGTYMEAPFWANQSMNAVASATCKTNGIPHGFRFEMGKEILPSLAGKVIYLHAVSDIPGATNWALHNTDKVVIPTFGLGGKVESMWLDQSSGGLAIQGWACAAGLKSSVDVHLHVRSADPNSENEGYRFHGSMTANIADGHSSTTTNRCGTEGVLHGFRFLLTKQVTIDYMNHGLRLYALGLGKSARLENDGHGIPPYYRALKSYNNGSTHLVHYDDNEAKNLNYNLEGNLGYLFTGHNNEYPAGSKMLYSCWVGAWGRAFPTTDVSECGNLGGSAAGLGYVVSSGSQLGGAQDLRRCFFSSASTVLNTTDVDDHMARIIGYCPLFYSQEGSLGYLVAKHTIEARQLSSTGGGVAALPSLPAGEYKVGNSNYEGIGQSALFRSNGNKTYCVGPSVSISLRNPSDPSSAKIITVTRQQTTNFFDMFRNPDWSYESRVKSATRVNSVQELGSFANCSYN